MDMETAIEELIENIKADYLAWTTFCAKGTLSNINRQMIEEFNESFTVSPGRKYIKIVKNGSVWGFVVNTDDDKKFKKGAILKAAGWAAPARNFSRGNVLTGGYTVTWTGAA